MKIHLVALRLIVLSMAAGLLACAGCAPAPTGSAGIADSAASAASAASAVPTRAP